MKPFVSLCMIVKNEEKVLRRCLESVKELIDEIIIVDTGSIDRTEKIAKEYTEQIYYYEWDNNFANARNFAQKHASGEWILVLDADEYVDGDNLHEVIAELQASPQSIDALAARIYNFSGVYGEEITNHTSLRLYRNNDSISFARAIHEQLVKDGGELQIFSSDLVIYHSGYLKKTVREKEKNTRNVPLIKTELGATKNGFDYFNLGNEYLSQDNLESALHSYKMAYQLKRDISYSWVSFSVIQIVNCLIRLERYPEALMVIGDAEEIWSSAPDFPGFRGDIYIRLNRLDDAKNCLMNIVENKGRYQNYIASIDFLEFHPYKLLGYIFEQEGNLQLATEYYSKALSFNKNSYDVFRRLLNILSKNASLSQVCSFIEQGNWISDQPKLIRLINILLAISEIELSSHYVGKIQDERIRFGYRLKIVTAQKNAEDAREIIAKTPGIVLTMLNSGFYDLHDLVILSLLYDEGRSIVTLRGALSSSDQHFLDIITGDSQYYDSSSTEKNADTFIVLMERCIQLNQFELLDSLLDKGNLILKNLRSKLANLLYLYNYKDISMELYNEIGIDYLDCQAFCNIIDGLKNLDEIDDALYLALYALEQGNTDFRLYKHAIEFLTLKEELDEAEQVIEMALKVYPDSEWLKQQYINL